jgi:Xaa-Pro dipeptidase
MKETNMSEKRIESLRGVAHGEGIDAVALVPGANLFYLAGLTVHLSERLTLALLSSSGKNVLVLPELERPRAEQESRVPFEYFTWRDEEGFGPALERGSAALGLKGRLAVEYTAMRLLELRALEQVATINTCDVTPLLAELRMVKDEAELATMREAVCIVEAGLQAAIDAIRPGISEREVADIWNRRMMEEGAEGPSFETIVASGPNSANPHHTTASRQIQAGDLIILDGGARYQGYCSDITRTVAVGSLSDAGVRVYDAVLAANAAGRAAVKAGASGAEIDFAARDAIVRAGYGPAFVHRTGHGLGIEVHEPPYLHAASPNPLALGATFTIEPGVYIEGIGGVRIEDDVVITEGGAESLTTFRRELLIL